MTYDIQCEKRNFFGKSTMTLEKTFQSFFCQNIGTWSEFIHPTIGVKIGTPDLRILINGMSLPIELKVHSIKNGIVKVSNIRPLQISWHRNYLKHGGISLFISGCQKEDENWELLLLPIQDILVGKNEFNMESVKKVSINNMKQYLESICQSK